MLSQPEPMGPTWAAEHALPMAREEDDLPLWTRQYRGQLAPTRLGQMVMFGGSPAL